MSSHCSPRIAIANCEQWYIIFCIFSIFLNKLELELGLRSEKRTKADRLNASKETGENRGAKRPLLFGNAQQYCETVAGELPDLVMEIDSSLCEKSTSLEVDVPLHFPSGDRKKIIEDDRANSLIKNVAQQNWKAAVNIVFKHPACQRIT